MKPLRRDRVMNVVAIERHDGERYTVMYDDANRAEALKALGRWAVNPELSFTWYDAALMAQRIRSFNDGRRT